MTCDICQGREIHAELMIVSADLGEGAFLRVICSVCWHRMQYRAKLGLRLAGMRDENRSHDATALNRRVGGPLGA